MVFFPYFLREWNNACGTFIYVQLSVCLCCMFDINEACNDSISTTPVALFVH